MKAKTARKLKEWKIEQLYGVIKGPECYPKCRF